MQLTDFLLERQSTSKLTDPAPTAAQLDTILQAAMCVPDHGGLRPWRCSIATGKGRQQLADVFEQAAEQAGLSDHKRAKAAALPFRSPMVITVLSAVQDHPKVPHFEQWLSAGCVVMAMQQMAQALGLGGIWRTGFYATDPVVRTYFHLGEQDHIIGFLYLGHCRDDSQHKSRPSYDDLVTMLT